MNKKLIAAAVAAAMVTPAAANAAPKLYGHLQAEIVDRDDNNVSNTVVDDYKRGRLGVKGSEDLGGGLKAIYKFEWQVDTSDADPNDGSREAFVGLKGGFGAVKIGALKSPYKYLGGVKYDELVTTALQARDSNGANGGGMFSAVGNTPNSMGSNAFLQDSLSYKAKFGVATIWAAYQFAEGNSTTNGVDDNIVLGTKIKIGKAGEVVLAHAIHESNAGSTTDGTNTKIGTKWKFGKHNVRAQYETHSDDAANSDADAIFLGATFAFGKNNVIVQYGEIDNDANGNGTATADRDYAAIAYMHKFSKKTRVWAGYKTTDHTNGNNSQDEDAISLGMRVTF